MHDLHDLPKFSDGLSYIFVQHCRIEQQDQSIAIYDQQGVTPIPCASLALIMIGPGTSITHAAIKALSDNGCLAIWCGEEGVRFYASGFGETRSAKNIMRQAQLASIPAFRTIVAKKMYSMRFKENISPEVTIEQLRGREGVRMKMAYANASQETGVPWKGRQYNRNNWDQSDPINRALSAANACLYGLCHSAIISMGYSPALGFVHVGKHLSFVYDIADLYKVDYIIPICFEIVKQDSTHVDSRVRLACREHFKSNHLLGQIAEDIPKVFDIEAYLRDEARQFLHNIDTEEPDFTQDGSIPSYLWDPQSGVVAGGVNFGVNPSDPNDKTTKSTIKESSTNSLQKK